MGVNVYIEDERGERLRAVTDPQKCLKTKLDNVGPSVRLLQYVDPYGDAVFNYLQAPDVLFDLDTLMEQDTDASALRQLANVREIVALVGRSRHLYVRFSGD
jgi:hypothetical protein